MRNTRKRSHRGKNRRKHRSKDKRGRSILHRNRRNSHVNKRTKKRRLRGGTTHYSGANPILGEQNAIIMKPLGIALDSTSVQ